MNPTVSTVAAAVTALSTGRLPGVGQGCRLRSAGCMDHRVIGVVGCSGGVGASSLAVALALMASRRLGVCVAADGDLRGGGLDVTAGLEHLPGLRWPDLAAVQGDVDGAALVRSLPAQGALRVLAARGVVVPDEVVMATVAGLSGVCPVTVVDVGPRLDCLPRRSGVVVVSGMSARQLADAAVVVPTVLDAVEGGVQLVLRAGRRDAEMAEEVAGHLELPLLGLLRDDPRASSDADRGGMPGARRGSALASVAALVLDAFEGEPIRVAG